MLRNHLFPVLSSSSATALRYNIVVRFTRNLEVIVHKGKL
jgi:hypothetical protein